jgi:acetyl esterase/lipase
MVQRLWLIGVIGISLGLSSGCVGTENNKPSATTSGADTSPKLPLRIAYGSDSLQYGDLRLPKGAGPYPVIVVLHGGCWVNAYALDLMQDMSDALTAEGFATWNVEYRRIGDVGSDYPNTLLDVGLAVDHLRTFATEHALDLSKVTTVGHSAGGHLAVWVAARQKLDAKNPLHGTNPLPIRAAVSLAGVLDLAESVDLSVCNGIATKLMGGSPSEVPAHYAEASPKLLLPIGVRQSLVHGNADTLVPVIMSQNYVDAAIAAGETNVALDVVDGADHFDMITPSSSKWPRVLKAIVDVAR